MSTFGSARLDDDVVALPPVEGPGEFSKGLRSGLLGMESQLKSVAGGIGAAVGADQFAAERNRRAAEMAQQAQAVGPRVSSYTDVRNLRDAADYAGGLFGQAAPTMAAGIGAGALTALTGGGALAALGVGALVNAPFETGDILQRQQLDPEARMRGAGENLARGVGGGLVSSVGQALLPAAVGGKLIGKAVQGAERTAFKEAAKTGMTGIGKETLKGSLTEFGTEFGGELTKQVAANENKPLDWQAGLEAGVGGAVVGVPTGALGGMADFAHGQKTNAIDGMVDLAKRGTAAVKASPGAAKDAAGVALDATGEAVNRVRNGDTDGLKENIKQVAGLAGAAVKDKAIEVTDRLKKAFTKKDDSLDRVEKGQELLDEKESAELGDPQTVPERARALLQKSTASAKNVAIKAAQALSLDKAISLNDEDRARVQKVIDGAGDTADNMWVATKAKAVEGKNKITGAVRNIADKWVARKQGGKDLMAEIDAASEAVVARGAKMNWSKATIDAEIKKRVAEINDRVIAEEGGKKKSEDFSGLRQAIADNIRMPDEADDASINIVAEGIRKFFAGSHHKDEAKMREVVEDLRPLMGEDTEEQLMGVYSQLVEQGDEGDLEAFAGGMGKLQKERASRNSLKKVITDIEGEGETADAMTDALVQWANGNADNLGGGAKNQLLNSGVHKQIKERFGDKAPLVYEALEKHLDETALNTVYSPDEYSERALSDDAEAEATQGKYGQGSINESQGERAVYSTTYRKGDDKSPQPLQSPEAHKTAYPDDMVKGKKRDRPAQDLIDKLNKKWSDENGNPTKNVRWISAAELHDDPKKSSTYGYVIVEDMPRDGDIDDAAFRNARLNTDKYAKSKSRMTVSVDDLDAKLMGIKKDEGAETYTLKVDAMKLARAGMNALQKITKSDGMSDKVRIARGYHEAMAQMIAKFGVAPEMPDGDNTVIGYIGDKPFTAGDAKKLDVRTSEDREKDAKVMRLASLRKQLGQEGLSKEQTNALMKEGKKIASELNFAKSAELGKDTEATPLAEVEARLRGAVAEISGLGVVPTEEMRFLMEELTARGDETKSQPRRKVMESNKVSRADETDRRFAPSDEVSQQLDDLFGSVPIKPTRKALSFEDSRRYETLQKQIVTLRDVRDELQNLERFRGEFELGGPLGRTDVSDNDNIHTVVAKDGKKLDNVPYNGADKPRVDSETGKFDKTTMAGGSKLRDYDRRSELNKRYSEGENTGLKDAVSIASDLLESDSPNAQKLGQKLEWLVKNNGVMSAQDKQRLIEATRPRSATDIGMMSPKERKKVAGAEREEGVAATREEAPVGLAKAKPSDYSQLANDLVKKYGAALNKKDLKLPAKAEPAWDPDVNRDQRFPPAQGGSSGSTPNPKAGAAQVAALDQAASSSDPALLDELKTAPDIAAVRRTADHLVQNHPDSKAAEVARERMAAAAQDEQASLSMQKTQRGFVGPIDQRPIREYLDRTLGNSVQVAWEALPHAGEFERTSTGDVIRLSIHALNPKSVAFHESLHAFFQQLRDAGAAKIGQVLEKAASQPRVQRWMENHFKNEPNVVQQIKDNAEERAAYMYQLYFTEPSFRGVLNPQASTIFEKIAQFIRTTLGIWSNDQRAIEIMNHFESGEYAKNIGKPNTAALLGKGTNAAVETIKSLAQPFMKLGDSVFAAGSSRLRDTNIAALIEIADLIKPEISGSTKDAGYVQASRTQFTARLNAWGESLAGSDKTQIAAALEHLQRQTNSSDPAVQAIVDKTREQLQKMREYMVNEGRLKVGNLGPDYFPRVWDAHTISTNQQGFLNMMEKYVQSGQYTGDPKELMRKLIANDGNDFDVDSREPGMQHMKERELAMITHDDAADFSSKDLFQTMSSYIQQATRRTEWARRFGAESQKLNALLKEADRNGASTEQLQMVERYLKGVTGTLGDSINPSARRLMGNAIVYQNIRLLPLAIFSSIVDPMGIVVRGGTISDAWSAFKRGVREVPLNFKKYNGANRDGMTLLSETLGVIENASLMHSLGALYSQGMVGSTGRKINDAFFRFNLMEQYNRSMRVSATETALHFISRHAMGIDPKNSDRFLAELGITKADVQMDMALGRMKLTMDDGLSKDHAERMRAAVNKWVDGAILRPDQADKPIWFNDPHFALVSHLKQFVYAFHHTIIDRVIKEAKEGNYKPMAALGGYVPIMIAADSIKGMIQGGGEQPAWKKDWSASDYIWNGVQRAGLFGVGQMGVDMASDIQRGGAGFGALTGPTIEQLTDAVQVAGGAKEFAPFTIDALPANALYKNINVGE